MMTNYSESFAKWFNPLQDYLELTEKNLPPAAFPVGTALQNRRGEKLDRIYKINRIFYKNLWNKLGYLLLGRVLVNHVNQVYPVSPAEEE